jgi:hypothetical protein
MGFAVGPQVLDGEGESLVQITHENRCLVLTPIGMQRVPVTESVSIAL